MTERGRHPVDVLTDTGMAVAYQAVVLTLRPLVTGRRIAVRVDDGTLALTVTRLSGTGRHVRLEARDGSWGDVTFDRASVLLRNVHLRGRLRPALVAAPVELTVELPVPALDELFSWAAPRLAADIGPDGVARLHFAKRRGSGYVEVDARLDGATLWVTPRAVVRRRRWPLPGRTPSYRVQLPRLPHGLELTSVGFAPGVLRLTGTLPRWRVDVPRHPGAFRR